MTGDENRMGGSGEKYLVNFVVDGLHFSDIVSQKVDLFVALSVVVGRVDAKIREKFVLVRLDPDLAVAKNHIKLVIGDGLPVCGHQIVDPLGRYVHQHSVSVRAGLGHEGVLSESCDEVRG